MTIVIDKEVKQGIVWQAMSGLRYSSGGEPSVCVPLSSIIEMGETELGHYLKEMIHAAREAEVYDYVDYINGHDERYVLSVINEPDFQKDWNALLAFEGRGENIQRAIDTIRFAQAERDKRVAAKTKKAPKPQPGYIYLIKGVNTQWYKIGKTIDPTARIKAFNTQGPFRCEFVRLFEVEDTRKSEAKLHDLFREKRVEGEWFNLDQTDVEWLTTTTATSAEEFEAEGASA